MNLEWRFFILFYLIMINNDLKMANKLEFSWNEASEFCYTFQSASLRVQSREKKKFDSALDWQTVWIKFGRNWRLPTSIFKFSNYSSHHLIQMTWSQRMQSLQCISIEFYLSSRSSLWSKRSRGATIPWGNSLKNGIGMNHFMKEVSWALFRIFFQKKNGSFD